MDCRRFLQHSRRLTPKNASLQNLQMKKSGKGQKGKRKPRMGNLQQRKRNNPPGSPKCQVASVGQGSRPCVSPSAGLMVVVSRLQIHLCEPVVHRKSENDATIDEEELFKYSSDLTIIPLWTFSPTTK